MFSLAQLRRLYPSVQEHHLVEAETRRLLETTLDPRYIAPAVRIHGTLRYAQRNIFSILFLSVYRSLGISLERRVFYGVVNHAVRGIVTAADNILDDEYKEMLPLRFPASATRFKSIMHILLFDRFLARAVDEATEKGVVPREERDAIQKHLFDALIPIGAEEASEEGGVGEVMPPSEILSSVHMYKGGNLLRLAFVAPRLMEKALAAPLERADRGTYRIGMALQVIDDLTDFYCDIRDRRHNYLVSSIRFEGPSAERERLDRLLAGDDQGRPSIELAFSQSVQRVMERAIGEALAGFDLLHGAGFWIDRRLALVLIRHLFRLRGVPSLLALLPKRGTYAVTLEDSQAHDAGHMGVAI
jgi:hypothetical protein